MFVLALGFWKAYQSPLFILWPFEDQLDLRAYSGRASAPKNPLINEAVTTLKIVPSIARTLKIVTSET